MRVLASGDDRTEFEVGWPSGPQRYGSARSMLRAIYSGGDGSLRTRDPGVSFVRYFRLDLPPVPIRGPWTELLGLVEPQPTPRQLTVATRTRSHAGLRRRAQLVVEAPWWDSPVLVGGVRPLPVGSWSRGGLTVVRPRRDRSTTRLTLETPKPEMRQGPVRLGIDLETRGLEVRKILYACFGARMARLGYDPDDVLQEVYRGLLARNHGRCPWDERKSSFGHYVHMVAECIIRNYTRKQRRIAQHEQVGVFGSCRTASIPFGMVDAALMAQETGDAADRVEEQTASGMALSALEEYLMGSGRPEAVIAVLALPHVSAGCSRQMISERISAEIGETVAPTEVGKALSFLRRETRDWAEMQGFRKGKPQEGSTVGVRLHPSPCHPGRAVSQPPSGGSVAVLFSGSGPAGQNGLT